MTAPRALNVPVFAADPAVMGAQRLGRAGRIETALLLALVALSIVALGVLVVTG